MKKLWQIIKETLLEKSSIDPTTTFGSIKRWAAWILLFLVFSVVINSLVPSFSLHIGSFVLNREQEANKVDMSVLNALLTAIGTYILGGQMISNVTDTIQNYHNVTNPTDKKE
jgi:predicted oxidoreductase (fatty acid repression mutant protein)